MEVKDLSSANIAEVFCLDYDYAIGTIMVTIGRRTYRRKRVPMGVNLILVCELCYTDEAKSEP